MIVTQLKTEHKQTLRMGVNKYKMPSNTTVTSEYIHGDIRDYSMGYKHTTTRVISEDQVAVMKLWEFKEILNELHNCTVLFTEYNFDMHAKNTLQTNYSELDVLFKYECTSREAFKTLNQIKNSLILLQNIENRISTINPTYTYLLSLCIQPITNTESILKDILKRNISPTTIITILNKPRFRHYLKLLHPDTLFMGI